MAIFQKSVIHNHLATLDKEQVEKAFEKFKRNYSPKRIAEIKKLKEEEYQDGFLREIFVDVLGYTLKPTENYNLVREFKNQADGKKADGAVVKKGKAVVVIELKSTKTKDLKTITEQAFNYKYNQPDCKYVITSNFQKLRFYIDYANEYEEFDLFDLKKEDFELLYLILHKESILADLPLKLKTETRFHEENISNKLYKDYSDFKHKVYNNLVKNNPQYDKLTLFKKSQKFLDRLLFVFFAEDTGLVPPNAISKIVEQWETLKELDEYKSLYSRFVKFFEHLNNGHKYKTYELPAYNGGLFAPDEILDEINIDDEILKDDALKLSAYDFNTDVDVNILGHIFEHSLNEIEEITAEIEGTKSNKTKSKRKKDGVFYTPKYITQYIVENTIGKLCNEKRKELDIEEIEFDGTYKNRDGKLSAKGKKLFEKLNNYKEWLLTLKIIDPACGSGAFLNQALNFLIEEHKHIDDIIAELTGEAIRLFDTDKTILENNLFGVDINEESVEIARLSLWLRTAKKGRKLSNLNANIKCGNSLINDQKIAGDKAFKWEKEFPQVFEPTKIKLTKQETEEFEKAPDYLDLIEQNAKLAQEKAEQSAKLSQEAILYSKKVYELTQKQKSIVNEAGELYEISKGGFDVVIGNPPYFSISTIDKETQNFIKLNYANGDKNSDIYCIFYELGINLLKPNGILSYITSNQWLQAQYGKTLRHYFVENTNPAELINFGGFKVFKDATVDSSIFITRKNKCEFKLKACLFDNTFNNENIVGYINGNRITITDLNADKWLIANKSVSKLKEKIFKNGIKLKEHKIQILRGTLTGLNEAFIIDTQKKEELCKNNPENLKIIKPLLRGRDIHRYHINWAGYWLINTHNGYKNVDRIIVENYPAIKKHLDNYWEKLQKRSDKGKTPYNLRNCAYVDLFEKEKIIYPETTVRRAEFFRDKNAFFIDKTAFMIVGENLGYYQSILASKLMQWYLEFDLRSLGKNSIQYSKIFIENTPVPIPKAEIIEDFNKKSDLILENNTQLQKKKTKFLNRVKDNFEIEKISKKLNAFYDFDFKTFISELKKQKVNLSLVQQDEWEEYFNAYKTEINQIQMEINKTDNEIDQMVYKLYELTNEEIETIENE